MKLLLLCLPLGFLPVLLSHGQVASTGEQSAPSVMQRVSRQFRSLEGAIVDGDAKGILAGVEGLREPLEASGEVVPTRRPSDPDEFRSHFTRLQALLNELETLTIAKQIVGCRQAFDELRQTCVSCHVKFRADDERLALYPAVGNTVTGQIQLKDVDGDNLDDRSWVLIFLENRAGERAYQHARLNPSMSQKGQRFAPRILPVVRGTTVEFPNDDFIYHNVFSLSKPAPFDLGVYERGESRSVRMEEVGLVRVYCNLHPAMEASVVILANPHFTLTDRRGRFVIPGVPDGRFTIRAWNDMGAENSRVIDLENAELVEVSFELREIRRSWSHRNKFGRRYPEKY